MTTRCRHRTTRRGDLRPLGRAAVPPPVQGVRAADPHLLGKITAKEELEGLLVQAVDVLVQAVDGLARLMKRGHFKLPESVLAANATYRGNVDTVTAFSEESVELEIDRSVTRPKAL